MAEAVLDGLDNHGGDDEGDARQEPETDVGLGEVVRHEQENHGSDGEQAQQQALGQGVLKLGAGFLEQEGEGEATRDDIPGEVRVEHGYQAKGLHIKRVGEESGLLGFDF